MDKFTTYSVADGVNFNFIKDTRFKTGRASIDVFLPLEEKVVAANAVLPFLISKSCSKYQDFTALNRYLDELYGSSISADVTKSGETQVLSISASFLADEYALEKETISQKVTKLLCDMFFSPILVNGTFPQNLVDQEKRQLIEYIESEFNEKRIYAKNKCEEMMCKNERFGINKLGTKEKVAALTPSDVYSAWERILNGARIELTVLGNIKEPRFALETFREEFSKINRGNIFDCSTEVIKECKNPKDHSESMNLSQSKLVMGFRTGSAGDDPDTMAMRLAISIFGFSPHCKLFLNVREKYSLCYYCSASYDRRKGIMLVQSGVEKENIKRAKEEILNQLEEVKKGNFTEDDMNNIKRSLSNSYKTMGDYLSGMESFYLSQIFYKNKLSTLQYVEKLNSITKEEVIDAAKKINLDTTFVLEGIEKEV